MVSLPTSSDSELAVNFPLSSCTSADASSFIDPTTQCDDALVSLPTTSDELVVKFPHASLTSAVLPDASAFINPTPDNEVATATDEGEDDLVVTFSLASAGLPDIHSLHRRLLYPTGSLPPKSPVSGSLALFKLNVAYFHSDYFT